MRLTCLLTLCAATTLGCGSDVLLGAVDADATGDADVGDADSGEPDAETALLDCSQGMLCAQACGTDMACATDCEGRVCPTAAAAFSAFRDCGLNACITQCGDFGSDGCVTCVAAQCPLQALSCLNSEC